MRLTDEQEKRMSAAPAHVCAECGRTTALAYCGKCDSFYSSGHEHGCKWDDSNCDDCHGMFRAVGGQETT